MPIYEFECPLHGRFERIFPISLFAEISEDGIMCDKFDELYHKEVLHCGEIAKLVWSLPANIQIGKPTIVFTNPQTGEARIATSEFDQAPKGFVKSELKSSIERSRFENQQNAINAAQDDIYNETIRQKREEFRSSHIAELKSHMPTDAATSDNPSATEALMKSAIQHIRNKPALPKKRKTEFALDVNHKDRSNLGT